MIWFDVIVISVVYFLRFHIISEDLSGSFKHIPVELLL